MTYAKYQYDFLHRVKLFNASQQPNLLDCHSARISILSASDIMNKT